MAAAGTAVRLQVKGTAANAPKQVITTESSASLAELKAQIALAFSIPAAQQKRNLPFEFRAQPYTLNPSVAFSYGWFSS